MFTEAMIGIVGGCNLAMLMAAAITYDGCEEFISKKWHARLLLGAPFFGFIYIGAAVVFGAFKLGLMIHGVAGDAELIKPSGGIVERERGQLSEAPKQGGELSDVH